MSNSTEREIIRTALQHPGLLSASEVRFIKRIGTLPDRIQLSVKEVNWLYDIARKKLGMAVGAPAPRTITEYRGRVCA